MDNKTIDFYNHNAEKYFKWRSGQGADRAQQVFLQSMIRSGHILDLGCGTGEKSLWFKENGLRVTAIDASPEMLKYLTNIEELSCRQMDIRELKFEEKFDGIWASFSVQHLTLNEQNLLFAKIPRNLKVGGVFYLGIHEGNQSYRDQLGRLYVPRMENDLRDHYLSCNLSIFEFFREHSTSFDGKPIEVMHLFAKLKN